MILMILMIYSYLSLKYPDSVKSVHAFPQIKHHRPEKAATNDNMLHDRHALCEVAGILNWAGANHHNDWDPVACQTHMGTGVDGCSGQYKHMSREVCTHSGRRYLCATMETSSQGMDTDPQHRSQPS